MQSPTLRVKTRRTWVLIPIFGCLLLMWGVFGLGLQNLSVESPGSTPSFRYESSSGEPVIYTYSILLSRHKDPYLDPPRHFNLAYIFSMYVVLQLMFTGLVLYSGKIWVFLLDFFTIAVQGCLFIFFVLISVTAIFDSGVYLYHQQTVKFNSQIYHLTLENSFTNDPAQERWQALLFECDSTGDKCSIKHSAYDRDGFYFLHKPHTSLRVDEASDTLELYVEEERVFTVPPISTSK